jgi:hypothetical protein
MKGLKLLLFHIHRISEGATPCIAALRTRLTIQKNSLRTYAINSFFCYVSRILRTTLHGVQLITLGL